MCNEAYRRAQIGQVAQDWRQTRIPLRFPEGKPNFAPLDSIRITDRIEIIRAARTCDGHAHKPAAEMIPRRWSWPGPSGKPVYNFRSYRRAIADGASRNGGYGRCLIPVDGFFEFTDPPPLPPTRPNRRRSRYHAVSHAPGRRPHAARLRALAADLCRPLPAGTLAIRRVR